MYVSKGLVTFRSTTWATSFRSDYAFRFSGEFLSDNGNGCSQTASRACPSVVRYSFTMRGLRLRPCKEGLRCAWNKLSRFGEQLWQTASSSSWRNRPSTPFLKNCRKIDWFVLWRIFVSLFVHINDEYNEWKIWMWNFWICRDCI